MDRAGGSSGHRPDESRVENVRWDGGEETPAGLRLDDFVGWAGVLGVHGPEYWGGWRPPRIRAYNSLTGDVNQVRRSGSGKVVAVGSGHAWDDAAHAARVAICEGLERYAALIYDTDGFTRARATDLGSDALDLDELATFSEQEIAESGGFLDRPSKDEVIRWTRGVDLCGGGEVMVPAVMAYALTDRLRTERFWLPFSTGTAIHETLEKALLAALCEVIERDACSIVWLQQMPIPVLDDGFLGDEAREIVGWFDERGVQTFLFDATTDVGIPVVWCTQFSPHGRHTAQTTATACDLNQKNAALKSILECSRFTPAIEASEPGDAHERFADINSGAAYTGMRARRPAFDFLVSGYRDRRRAEPRGDSDLDPRRALKHVLERLSARGCSVYAVDMTTREVADAGLACVKVIVPQAQPLSVWPRAQYRGSTRLYELPRFLNHVVRPESELNPYPLPVS
ncbi:YcaO-like family protein [Plantactinospora sp. B5E13]|uniref:YcaO-like family protein n=1 Tax=Plantactinospora sp. B5E13 TaxID=3153758 RepID=UPI00325E7511